MDQAEKGYDFAAAEVEYHAGGISMNALAQKFGIPEASLRRHAKKHGWVKGAAEAKRELVREALAGEGLDEAVTNKLTNDEVRQLRVAEATQDVEDMNRGLEVARKVLDKLLVMVDGIDNTADIKRLVDANKGAIETIRKIRALDDDVPPEAPETNVNVSVDPGFTALRQAFQKRLAGMSGGDSGDAAATA